MTRLPELERELQRAAEALERRRRPWWRISLLGGGATFALAATAFAAAELLLPEGDPVPKAPPEQRASLPDMDPGTTRLTSLRAEDPGGGLPWGLSVTRDKAGNIFCAQVGRVQDGKLGVIGRDGTFKDDGRFHPLSPDANQSGVCGGSPPGGDLRLSHNGPPIPASGFTGSFLSPAGGCREHVANPKATMSPQTRRKLRNVPVCKASSLRVVKYGFAGRGAVEIEYGGVRIKADPEESGAYLFVLKPRKGRRLTLNVKYDDGTVCRERSVMDIEPCP
ncbi:hypothetical protein OJ997_09810 [Solirubrobacter phytolaccae]|uniref:Uncharacterized protein n=1 Tax=Solirubrobacter phytolaccae TaxID=1404360 RepID=A0A9X3SEP0_9ACTN|nr:hypothetical protein [Solirubrobacter phytolaccae]MDA0180587.1 hypothetical protein [Solirubrobacter phytolaccae]